MTPSEPEQSGKRDLHGEDGRLGVFGPVDLGSLLVGSEDRTHGETGTEPAEERIDLGDLLCKDWRAVKQAAPHRPPLLAHAREDKGEARLSVRNGRAGNEPGGLEVASVGLQQLDGIVMSVRHGGQANRMMLASAGQRRRDIGKTDLPPLGRTQKGSMLPGARPQCVLAAGREAQQLRFALRRSFVHGRGYAQRRRTDDGVGIGAAKTEGIDSGNPPAAIARLPVLQLRRHAQVQGVEGDGRVGRHIMKVGRDAPVALHQRHLDQAGNARRRFGMSEIALDRTDHTGGRARLTVAEDRAKRVGLNRIADRRPRTMRLDIGDVARPYARTGDRIAHDAHLRFPTGNGDTLAAAVLVDCAPLDDGVDFVTVGDGVGQSFQQHHADAIRARVTVGA